MLPKKTKYTLYAVLLVFVSAIYSTAVANTTVFELLKEVSFSKKEAVTKTESVNTKNTTTSYKSINKRDTKVSMTPMFMTLVQGADAEVTCNDTGSTVAQFFLCGDADDRTISLSGGPYANVSWQRLGGPCSPDTNTDCPDTSNLSCYTNNVVSTAQTLGIDASTISATEGAEYRVVVDGTPYYIEVTKSTIDLSYLKDDYICNSPGRIELTGLPNNYEFRIKLESDPSFGPTFQSSSVFSNLNPGRYEIETRLNIGGDVCIYRYPVIEIFQEDIAINVTFTDALCSGDSGSISVEALPNNVGPYVFTLLDENGAEIEFTSTIASNTHTFTTVSAGTYSVQVETNECKEDIPNGIAAPTQDRDINGDPITIGNGLNPINVITDTNGGSFGCATITSVDIDVTVTGGSGPYTYTVDDGGNSGGSFSSTDTYTVTTEGTYTFTITDSAGCTATKSEYIASLDPPIVTATNFNGTCTNGGGRIDFNVVDARGFNLEFRAANTDAWSTAMSLPVADGTYNTIEVRYFQGAFECILPLPSETVTSESGLTGSSSITQDYTCANGGGIIEFDAGLTSGGSGTGYQYSLDNVTYQAGTSFTGLAPGTYVPYIRDNAGCSQGLAPLVISDPEEPSAIDFVQDNLNCAAGTSRVTINVTSGVAITQYAITSPTSTSQASNIFPGLLLDTSYQFEITDANGCVHSASFTTGGFSTIRARVKSGGDTRVCPGATDGFGAFLIDGFGIDYDYTITGPSTALSGTSSNSEIPISGLGVGTYTISVTDNETNCINTANLVIEEPTTPLSVTGNVTAMSCQNNNIGRVQANAGAGSGFGGYRYELEWPSGTSQGPKTGRTFGNLTETGTYTLTIIDSEGCTATDTFTLSEVDAPVISLVNADRCFSPTNDGEITVSSTAGTAALGTHRYRLGTSGATQVSPVFPNLSPGTYTVQVVDGNNCTDELTVTIPPQIQVTLDIISEISCDGDGLMQININGGDISNLAATSYTIFKDGIPVAGHTGNTLPSASFPYTVPYGEHGDYTVEVTDNNSCTNISVPRTYTEPTTISATERIVGPSCGDLNSGFVEIYPTVSSGVPPFQTVLAPASYGLIANPNDPDPAVTNIYDFSSQTIYSGLAAGDYHYIVKDDRNCITGIIAITIAPDGTVPPSATVTPVDATCAAAGEISGGVIIDVADGSPNYTIRIEDEFGNLLVERLNVAPGDLPLPINDSSLVPGNYQVAVIDSRGCLDIEPLTIGTATLDITPAYPPPPATCLPGGATVCVEISGGTLPIDYSIRLVENPVLSWEGPNNGPTNHCFTGLLYGVSYTVEVRDDNTNCTYDEVITLPDGPGVDVTLSIDNLTCRNGNVGLNYTVTTGTAPFDIVITNLDTGVEEYNQTTSDATFATPLAVPSGRYGISVVDAGNCSGGAEAVAALNLPRVDIIENINANCNAPGQLTVRGSGGTPYGTGSPYFYAYMPSGVPPVASNFTDATTVSLPGSSSPGTDYDIWVQDSRGCNFMINAAVIQLDPALPAPTINVNNQCNAVTPPGGFTITVEIPGDIDTPTFTLNGSTQTPAYVAGTPTQATFTVGSIGTYPVNVIDANGCDVDAIAEVYEILSASGGFGANTPTCANADGTITITANGGSGNFDFELQDNLGTRIINNSTGIFNGVPPGEYQVLLTDDLANDGSIQCTVLVDGIVSDPPVTPVIQDIGKSDMSCHDVVDGSISVALQTGTDSDGIQEYNLYVGSLPLAPTATPIVTQPSGEFTGLGANTYVVEVVTDKGCTDVEEFTIVNPPAFEITWDPVTFACETGANRYSTATISTQIVEVGNGAPYRYRLNPTDSYQSSGDFEIVDNGSSQTITVYAIDANGCEHDFTRVIDPPSGVTGTIAQVTPMDCENAERITITVPEITNFIIEDQGSSVSPVANVVQTSGNTVTFDLPFMAGEYRLQINDPSGCIYPLEPYVVAQPVLPSVTISESEPISCFGAIDGALNIEVTNFTGIYDYWVYEASDPGFSGGAFGSVVGGNSTGSIDTAVDGNPFVIAGLPAGTLRVVIREQGKTVAGCSVFSDVAVIGSPNGPLTITNVSQEAVGCSDNLGEIVVTASGGWETTPYQYMLEIENPVGSGTFVPHTPLGNSNTFTGLSAGLYRITVTDSEDCSTTSIERLSATPIIEAEAMIFRELECPEGNDAVIQSVEPGTTTQGAIGGVSGAGYQYRLLTLNSNDRTDVASSTGLQSDPRFVGSAGTGVIEAGWYAIEVVSTLNCSTVTDPIQVIPPLPINPRLIQTAVPACGNIATMKIELGSSAEVGATYEYRNYLSADPWLPMTYQNGTAEENIPGTIGLAYRYEVRKVGDLSSCEPKATNGITITGADPLSLDINSPTFDVTCSYEVDGRIEAHVDGGTGIYEFRIYNTDPGTDAFAAEFLPTYENRAVQSTGTFEDLGAGDYWISVISRLDCGVVQGPFSIAPAEPVIIADSSTPVTCNGEADGTITMEVTSATSGLVKFAIEPNLSELVTDPDNPTTYTFTDLSAGTYTVLAQDAEGCPQTFSVTVTEPEVLQVVDIVTTPELCIGANDGTLSFDIVGGTQFNNVLIHPTPYYEFKFEKISPVDETGTGVFAPYDGQIIENLEGGASYALYIRDANGCETTEVISITIGVDLTAEPIIEYGCEGIFPNSTTTIAMQETSLLPDLLFALDPVDPTDPVTAMAGTDYVFGNLAPGNHTVYIYHENGCTNMVDFTIDAYDPLTLTAIKTGPNELTASAEGGYGGYEFFFQGESYGSETIYTTNESTVVEVRVVDSNGCAAMVTVPFEFTGMLDIPNAFTPDGDGLNDLWSPNNREFFPNIEVKIYDRYGRVVAILNNVTQWDGNYEGSPVPTGDYWYVVNANDKSKIQFVGHFTLYR
ncbi:T9SS type B sorting domain-containing protein [uncultured Maribacter sp.]|uniref:T9SS type B sorting domain-containing protein n=1 Tax=uncultured Maribacter sp. TaxID=431308 RepID=UPI0026378FDC|nr:T9SS type B sorting domain-containing protein [uncultured Maribacter sp.]